MPPSSDPLKDVDAASAARPLAAALDGRGVPYAFGGAIALAYWGTPRGSLSIDLTLFLPAGEPSACVALLQEIGCELVASEAIVSLTEHGFCRAAWRGVRVDVFVPSIAFYEIARQRRKTADLAGVPIAIWDAESLVVFKMMFFRLKDLADVEQVLRTQGAAFDRAWVRRQLEAIYGPRDPRLARWDELAAETGGS